MAVVILASPNTCGQSAKAAGAAGACFRFEPIDEIDGGEEAAARSGADAASGDGDGEMGLAGSGRDSDMAPVFWRVKRRSHYAFHPLAGKTVASTGRRVMYGGVEHVTIRLTDGTFTLTPAWMMRPEAAAFAIRPAPRLCVARLRDLRAHLDALLGSGHGDSSPTGGADHAPEPPPTTGPVRRAAKSVADSERTSPGDGGDSAKRF